MQRIARAVDGDMDRASMLFRFIGHLVSDEDRQTNYDDRADVKQILIELADVLIAAEDALE